MESEQCNPLDIVVLQLQHLADRSEASEMRSPCECRIIRCVCRDLDLLLLLLFSLSRATYQVSTIGIHLPLRKRQRHCVCVNWPHGYFSRRSLRRLALLL